MKDTHKLLTVKEGHCVVGNAEITDQEENFIIEEVGENKIITNVLLLSEGSRLIICEDIGKSGHLQFLYILLENKQLSLWQSIERMNLSEKIIPAIMNLKKFLFSLSQRTELQTEETRQSRHSKLLKEVGEFIGLLESQEETTASLDEKVPIYINPIPVTEIDEKALKETYKNNLALAEEKRPI